MSNAIEISQKLIADGYFVFLIDTTGEFSFDTSDKYSDCPLKRMMHSILKFSSAEDCMLFIVKTREIYESGKSAPIGNTGWTLKGTTDGMKIAIVINNVDVLCGQDCMEKLREVIKRESAGPLHVEVAKGSADGTAGNV